MDTNIVTYQFETEQVRTLIDEKGEFWFSAKDIWDILNKYVGCIENICEFNNCVEFLPPFISFQEALCLLNTYPHFRLASLLMNIVIDNISKELWVFRYVHTWSMFVSAYFSECAKSSSELYQQDVLKNLFVSGSVKGFEQVSLMKPDNSLPDLKFESAGKVYVVEMKKGDFKQRMVKQISTYVEKERADIGLIVAQSCSANLLDNLIFIEWTHKPYDLERLIKWKPSLVAV